MIFFKLQQFKILTISGGEKLAPRETIYICQNSGDNKIIKCFLKNQNMLQNTFVFT